MNLKGRVAVVTGGAMGNGLGIVEVFCELGASVAILDYSIELKNVIDTMYAKGYDVSGFKVDIRDKDKVDLCIEKIIERYKKIDILVNNAGICELGRFIDMNKEVRDKLIDVNIKGTWNVTKSVIPYMINNNSGSIINVSCIMGRMMGSSNDVMYATTKAAIDGFTKSLAREYANSNIRVNAVLPGYVLTSMVENMTKLSNQMNPDMVIDGIVNSIPMKRFGTSREIGNLVAFLASDMSSYMTGSEIIIDGGLTLSNSVGV